MRGIMFKVLAASLIVLSGAAHAASPETHKQTMTYQLYAGGIHAVETEIELDYKSRDRYSLQLDAKTRGFLGKVAPWNGRFESHGWRMDDGYRPQIHKSSAIWRKEEEIKEYSYNKNGGFDKLTITEDGQDRSPSSLDDALVQGTTDALTAALEAMQMVGSGQECSGESEVFDGKRRFKMVFRDAGEEMLNRTRYNVFEGAARQCEVEVVPVSGAWHKKPRGWASIQEQGRAKGSLPTIWLAKIDEQGPAVPVKLRVKTDYGTLFMHMTRYEHEDIVMDVSQ